MPTDDGDAPTETACAIVVVPRLAVKFEDRVFGPVDAIMGIALAPDADVVMIIESQLAVIAPAQQGLFPGIVLCAIGRLGELG